MYFRRKEITPSSHTYPYLAAAGRKPAAATLSVVDPFLLYKRYVYPRFHKPPLTRSLPGNLTSEEKAPIIPKAGNSGPFRGHFFHPYSSGRTLRLLVAARSFMDRGAIGK